MRRFFALLGTTYCIQWLLPVILSPSSFFKLAPGAVPTVSPQEILWFFLPNTRDCRMTASLFLQRMIPAPPGMRHNRRPFVIV
jgi:hypothetical protein